MWIALLCTRLDATVQLCIALAAFFVLLRLATWLSFHDQVVARKGQARARESESAPGRCDDEVEPGPEAGECPSRCLSCSTLGMAETPEDLEALHVAFG